MKNLELSHLTRVKLKTHIQEVLSSLILENDTLWIAFPNKVDTYDLKSGLLIKSNEIDNVLTMNYLEFEKFICVTTINNLVFIALDEICDLIVIDIAERIYCAEWSPIQDSIAIIGKDYIARTVNIDCRNGFVDYTGEINFMTAAKDLFVNVGWGSKNTQFHGSVGKSKTNAIDGGDDINFNKIPTEFFITWNGEGKFFAVGYSIEEKHHFKIFSNPCKLLYKGEYLNGLQKQLSWRPEGSQLIAGYTITDRENCVVLFEKNGLYKDKFKMRHILPVEKMEWSQCGQILAIWLKDAATKMSHIELWTTSNYHWFLKQSLQFTSRSELQHFYWSKMAFNKMKQLVCLTSSDLVVYNFKYSIHRTVRHQPEDRSCVATIDGTTLKLTSFKQQVMAPPYAEIERIFHSPINFVSFGPCGLKLCVVLSDSSAVFLSMHYSVRGVLTVTQEREFRLRSLFAKSYLPLSLSHFVWRCCHTMLFVEQNEEDGFKSNNLHTLDVTSDDQCPKAALLAHVSHSLNCLLPDYNYGFVIQQEDNVLSHLLNAHENPFLEENCHEIAASLKYVHIARIKLDQEALDVSTIVSGNKFSVFSHTLDDKLYCDEFLIANSVTSFILHNNYLLFTTAQNDLYVLRIHEDFNYSDLKLNYCRKLAENSCKIITAVTDSSEVILQTPRGNLETISIRLLGIDVVEKYLQQDRWEEAYLLMRKTRLNLNLFVDLNHERFFSNIDLLVDGIKSVDGIYAFLMDLKDVNVFNTMYANCRLGKSEELPNKRETVASAMLQYFELHNYTTFMNPTLTCCIIMNDMPKSLRYIKHLLESEKTPKLNKVLQSTALKALQHLGRMVSTEALYETALALYDLDLALFVAVNGNMDPMEFMPVLNELRLLDAVYMRFKVNDMLRRFDTALKYLCKCLYIVPTYDILFYVEKHQLYKLAMKYMQDCPNKVLVSKIALLYARHLSHANRVEEAAYFFKLGMDFESAIKHYRSCGNWVEALAVCKCLDYTDKQNNEFLVSVLQQLSAANKFDDCAKIYEKHLNQFENAITYYLLAENFPEAIQCALKNNRQDLIETHIKTAILSCAQQKNDTIVEMINAFNRYTVRLQTIREDRLAQLYSRKGTEDIPGIENDVANDYDDLYSETGSVSSALTKLSSSSRSSSRSSRSRRKDALKIIDLKFGGEYEDIALMNALHKLIAQAYDMRKNVRQLCLHLMEVDGIYGLANTLYNNFHRLLNAVQCKKTDIWPKQLDPLAVKSEQHSDEEYKALTQNFQLLDLELRHAPIEVPFYWEISVLSS